MTRAASVVLAYGFRPFFLLASLYAPIIIGAWLCLYTGLWSPPQRWPLFYWHGHEMIFGFAGAAIAGFLLTAVPSWTETRPVRGLPLAGLAAVWLAGRAALWSVDLLPAAAVGAVDVLFFPLLIFAVGPPIARARKLRNYPVAVLLVLLFGANLAMHLQTAGIGGTAIRVSLRLAVYTVVAMVAVISGRITPLFTQNALRRRGRDVLVSSNATVDRLAMLAMLVAMAFDLTSEGSRASAVAWLLAAALMLVRQWPWRFRDTLSDPLVWILHLSHFWLVVGFAAKGLVPVVGVFPGMTAFHALTAGAIGTAVLGITSRVALGHTGRELRAAPIIVLAYASVLAGAAVRVFGPLVAPLAYKQTVVVGGSLWALAFVLFLVHYTPILTRPRPDGQPG